MRARAQATVRVWKKRLEKAHSRSNFRGACGFQSRRRRSHKSTPVTLQYAAFPTYKALYLAVNADVAAAIARKDFKSGREHYEFAGRAERRLAVLCQTIGRGQYLQVNSDVASAVSAGTFQSGYHHYLVAGRTKDGAVDLRPGGRRTNRFDRRLPDCGRDPAPHRDRGKFVRAAGGNADATQSASVGHGAGATAHCHTKDRESTRDPPIHHQS